MVEISFQSANAWTYREIRALLSPINCKSFRRDIIVGKSITMSSENTVTS